MILSPIRMPLPVAAARLHEAAVLLHARGLPADPAARGVLARIAAGAPARWGVEQVMFAARAVIATGADLRAVGVDSMMLPDPALLSPESPSNGVAQAPAPQAPAAAAAPSPAPVPAAGAAWALPEPTADPAPARTHEPFDYEHTIDGLRGVPIGDISGVGAKTEEAFTKTGISTVYDLLMHVPFRYIARGEAVPIGKAPLSVECSVVGRVAKTSTGTTKSGMRYARVVITDGSADFTAMFFNAPWQAARFQTGNDVVATGKMEAWTHPETGHTSLSMMSPLLDRIGAAGDLIPIYRQSASAGLTTWAIHRAAKEALARLGSLTDPIPQTTLTTRGLMGREEALRQVHAPAAVGAEAEGRKRLAYDELLRMQLGLGMRRAVTREHKAVAHAPTGALSGPFVRALPFPLTGAQKRAAREITDDLSKPEPMNRLLQGDVGAGKTAVSVIAMLAAVESGHQAALMAPTEILATQHYVEIARLLADIPHPTGRALRVEAMTNRVKTKARREVMAGLEAGSVDVLVGTHALLSDDVTFQSLGLVVIDEQHRFGVEQRATLRDKGPGGARADMLAATATPIPRTAAMSVFGDLDVTVLDELPPGRTPIRTEWIDAEIDLTDRAVQPWATVRAQVDSGRQAYVVCPLVTESEKAQAASAEQTAEALRDGALSGLRIGLVHGKQGLDERTATMDAYAAGDLDVLVATTVIEVGVNVPNATVITILDPNRFGMAQLHQLRGRVGRGRHASACYLYGLATAPSSTQRLQALEGSTDGFVLSQIDLDIRGMGTVFGSQQAGQGDLRVASLDTDDDLIEAARQDAGAILATDPHLARRPTLRAEVLGALGADGAEWLQRG